MRRSMLFAKVLLAAAVTGSAGQPATPSPVSVVFVLQPPDMSPATIAKLSGSMAKIRTIAARNNNPGKARLFAPTFAGNEVGTLLIVVEYPSMQAMAEGGQRMDSDPEMQSVVGEIMGGGFKLVSQSLVTEITY